MKKRLIFVTVILMTLTSYAQSPQKMSYQCVIRNASGVLVTNQSVGIRISILQGTTSGTLVYQETYSPNPQTSANGLVTVEIGGGVPVSGTFSGINWAAGPYFLKTETDPTGGTNYTIVGTSQLLSVPYAMYANTAGNGFRGNSFGDMLYWNGTNWALLTKGMTGQILSVTSTGQPIWINILGLPSATTSGATQIGITGGILNGIVNANGLLTNITFEYGLTTSYGNSVVAIQSPILGNNSTAVNILITGLNTATTYHYRIKAVNTFGTIYGEDVSFTTFTSTNPISIGQFYNGGIVFYIDYTGQHGLVCVPTDQSQEIQWYNGTYITTNATGTAVGTGQSNTTTIVNAQGEGVYAARICDLLVLNGYSDWFLPSRDELQLMFNIKSIIGGFSSPYFYYWSSTEWSWNGAYLIHFGNGSVTVASKEGIGAGVRAIRAF